MSRLFFQPPVMGASYRMRLAAAYLAAGPLLHAATVMALVAIIAVAMCMAMHPLKVAALAGLGLTAIFAQLDARSRFQEFKQVRDQLIAFGPDPRIFKSMAGSRCRRDAALAAARQRGCVAGCRRFFADAGYRWYNLLPDRVCRHPGHLLTLAFWRATLFASSYQSRTPLASHTATASSHARYPWQPACRRSNYG